MYKSLSTDWYKNVYQQIIAFFESQDLLDQFEFLTLEYLISNLEIDSQLDFRAPILLFDLSLKTNTFELKSYDNYQDLEDMMLCESGVLNAFTTVQIPIINGQYKKYFVEFWDCRRQEMRRLSPARHQLQKTILDMYLNRKVVWE